MIRFSSDYIEGAHQEILLAMAQHNQVQMPGYGEDALCAEAADLIRGLCGAPDAFVHFVAGGTMANALVIAAALRPHQGVIAPASGHIAVHETGAIEATGHKIIALAAEAGKLTAEQVRAAAQAHLDDPTHEHTVQPRMVYISNPTEYGTLYTRQELLALNAACRDYDLSLFMDGARLGYGLCAAGNQLDLPTIASSCDAFTIGGTKVGALFGEAIVITRQALNEDFRYIEKQRGAMLAKGWLLGLQFKALFCGGEDGLYFSGARHGIAMAGKLAQGFARQGLKMLMPAETNQLFPILPHALMEKLAERYIFEVWQQMDATHSAVRFCTAWSTPEEHVDALLEDLRQLSD